MQLVFRLRTSKLQRVGDSNDYTKGIGGSCQAFPFASAAEMRGDGRKSETEADLHRLTEAFCRELHSLPFPIRCVISCRTDASGIIINDGVHIYAVATGRGLRLGTYVCRY